MSKAPSFAFTRRALISGFASLPFLASLRTFAAERPTRLIVVLGSDEVAMGAAATGDGWLKRAAAHGTVGERPLLVVGERIPDLARGSAPVALISPAALLALPATRLRAALRGPGPVRISAAYPASRHGHDDTALLRRFGELLSEPDASRFSVLVRNTALPNQTLDPEQAVTTLRARLGVNRSSTAIIIAGATRRSSPELSFLYLPNHEEPLSSRDPGRLAQRALADVEPRSG